MKKLLLLMFFFMSVAPTNAQDKIITINKDTIECRIVRVGEERINYEQKTSGTYYVGKSIDIADVLQYYRTEQTDGQYKVRRQAKSLQNPEHRYLFKIQGGLAYLFTDFENIERVMAGSGVTSSEAGDYTSKLRNGYHVDAEFHYLLTTFLGLGVDYNIFHSATEGNFLISGYGGMNVPMYVSMDLNEKIYIHFAGPSVLLQQVLGSNRKIKITEIISPGMSMFRNESRGNEYQIYNDETGYYYGVPQQYYNYTNTVSKSNAFSVKGGMSIEYYISPQLSAGVTGSFIRANLNKMSFKGLNFDMKDQELEKEVRISHVNYGIAVRFNF